MGEYVWSDMLTQTDNTVIKKGGYGKQRGFGHKPVLFVIDMEPELMGSNKSIMEQMEEYPFGAGSRAYKAADNINDLIDLARVRNIPVIYTKHIGKEISEVIHKNQNDYVVDKEADSAYVGTMLQKKLIELNVDTIIVTGAGTSTAARATLVDSITRMYNVGFVEDALFDRIKASHKTACLDVWMKFADVVTTAKVADYFKNL